MNLAGTTVLVTGGRGFLGRHVVTELTGARARVVAVGRPECDLRRRDAIARLLADVRPDAVVHLAAVVGGIGANESEPGRFLYENAIMGLELLEACRLAGVAKVLVAGTVCSYPRDTPVPFCEEHFWDGYPEATNAPYGLAKKLLLAQAQAYRQQYGLNAIYLLPVNLYGPGDRDDAATSHVIPALIRKFAEARQRSAERVTLWGDGSPTREFLHVTDAARAFVLALSRYEEPEPLNIGSGTEISIGALAELLAGITGFEGTIAWDTARPNGQPRRLLDSGRARRLLGFTPEVDFATGLRELVAHHEHQLHHG